MERSTFIKHVGASALSLCALGSLSLVRNSQLSEINEAFVLNRDSVQLQVNELAEGMQRLAIHSDKPMYAEGNNVCLQIGDRVRRLEIKVFS